MGYRLDYESLTVFVAPIEYQCRNCHFKTKVQALEEKHHDDTGHQIRSMPLKEEEEEYDPLKHGDLPNAYIRKLELLKAKQEVATQ